MTQGSNPNPYLEIGETLRIAREAMRVSTIDAAHELHIRHIYLEALEEGRLEDLPGAAYTKGYLQRYAAYLQLDKQDLLKQFERIESELNKRNFFVPEGLSREKKPTHEAVWGGGIAALAIYFLWWLLMAPSQAPVSLVEAPPQAVEKQQKNVKISQNLACAREKIVLYPPCHRTGWAPVGVLPKGQVKTVMDLATIKN